MIVKCCFTTHSIGRTRCLDLSTSTMPHHRRADLLEAATRFCNAFSAQKPLEELLEYFAPTESVALEHGLPQLAPFLGREFRGREGVREYFETVSRLLTYQDMRFGDYVVDAAERRVAVRGQARFRWTATNQAWDEVFAYILVFDVDHKIQKYEVWADSGAAYLASQGLLTASS
ncbi:hypothetical protein VTK73DRAFT_405 [Phialemonium thermophilum]|uniref:SnoaL-like domain-containing protein n=1 Tax=Phialemonium thermophilum TaxID=223376 RepID=A0ABR3XFF7_9PEZI